MDSTTIGIAANTTSALSASAATKVGNSAAKTAASTTTATTSTTATSTTAAQSSSTSTPSAEQADTQRDPRSLQFQVEGDRVITTIVDKNNKTVVIQIPDADMIRIAKSIDRMQGFLIEDKA